MESNKHESIDAWKEEAATQAQQYLDATEGLELAYETLKQGSEILKELHSQIGQDIDINPSAKRVYLSKIEYVGYTLLSQSLDVINRIK